MWCCRDRKCDIRGGILIRVSKTDGDTPWQLRVAWKFKLSVNQLERDDICIIDQWIMCKTHAGARWETPICTHTQATASSCQRFGQFVPGQRVCYPDILKSCLFLSDIRRVCGQNQSFVNNWWWYSVYHWWDSHPPCVNAYMEFAKKRTVTFDVYHMQICLHRILSRAFPSH